MIIKIEAVPKLAVEVAKGHRYFNAVEKNGKLHITGRVSARF